MLMNQQSILEWLSENGFSKTLKTFRKELNKRGGSHQSNGDLTVETAKVDDAATPGPEPVEPIVLVEASATAADAHISSKKKKKRKRKKEAADAANADGRVASSPEPADRLPVVSNNGEGMQSAVDVHEEAVSIASTATAADQSAVSTMTSGGGNAAKKRKTSNAPFRRVTEQDEALLNAEKFGQHTQDQYDAYGHKAGEVLSQVKGRNFRHEKTKKKRGTYRGGAITTEVKSIFFDD